jgi:hypothetical protein
MSLETLGTGHLLLKLMEPSTFNQTSIMKTKTVLSTLTLLALLSSLAQAVPLGTTFTYQGKLSSGPGPVTGLYDFNFTLWDAYSGGTQLGVTNLNAPTAVPVTNGLFTVTLDFGSGAFTGDARWLAITVRTNADPGGYHALPGRQPLLPAPQTLWAQSAGVAATHSVWPGSMNTPAPPSAGQVLTYDGAQLTWTTPGSAGSAWSLTGNSGTTSANFLGTTDNQPLEFRVKNNRALRLEIDATGNYFNLIVNPGYNSVGTYGSSIGGGLINSIQSGAYDSVIAGGAGNQIQTDSFGSVIAGGANNQVLGLTGYGAHYAAIAGGAQNIIEPYAWETSIGGGSQNRIQFNANFSVIAGGLQNTIATNAGSAVVSGGFGNRAAGPCAAVPGGENNYANGSWSFAAGYRAKALHNGTFVWADNLYADFASTGQGQFLIRASGGVGIGTASPQQLLHVGGASCFDGNVGIGTTSPQQKLHVVGSGSFDGNVGIGTTTPQEKLHVAGIGRFDVGVGTVNISSPGGNPGLIAFAGNGHRRDIIFQDNAMRLLVGTNSGPPSVGVTIFEDGTTEVKVLRITGGADLAEPFAISDAEHAPKGSVMVIDDQHPGQLRLSTESYDKRVAGVISGAGGLNPGLTIAQQGRTDKGAPVALSGRVYTLVDTCNGPIQPGDLLTTSSTPGHAMKATDFAKGQGAIIGKAMTGLTDGRGLVLVLVSLQ